MGVGVSVGDGSSVTVGEGEGVRVCIRTGGSVGRWVEVRKDRPFGRTSCGIFVRLSSTTGVQAKRTRAEITKTKERRNILRGPIHIISL
ncbi:MAG: hypothetical protein Fur0022_34910 [Anaerolineales bacterium]